MRKVDFASGPSNSGLLQWLAHRVGASQTSLDQAIESWTVTQAGALVEGRSDAFITLGRTPLLEVASGSQLVRLSLQACSVGDCGARILAEVLKQRGSLRALAISYDDVGVSGVTALCGALACPEAVHLQELDLSYNHAGAQGAAALGLLLDSNRCLTCLSLSANSIGEVGFSLLCKGLARNTSLATLRARDNGIEMKALFMYDGNLGTNLSLTELDLQGNNIGDVGAFVLAHLLASRTCPWFSLWLGENRIGREGAMMLAAALHLNERMHKLDLSWNPIEQGVYQCLAPDLARRIISDRNTLR